MKFIRTKTQWASLKFTADKQIIVCVKSDNSFRYRYFETAQQFKHAIDSKKLAVKNWIVSIPSDCYISKPLELPAANLDEAYKMTEFELSSLVPIPAEKLIYGCTEIKSDADMFTLLVHIVKADVIEQILKDYKEINITPARIIPDHTCEIESCTSDAVLTERLLQAIEKDDCKYINLLPKKMLKKARRRKLIITTAITVTLALLVIFSFWLNFAAVNWRISIACKKIKAQIAPVEHIASTVDSKRQRVKAIQKQLSGRNQISRILYELYKYTPKDISISHMQFISRPAASNINIKGQAKSLSNAFEYSDAMKQAHLLKNIQIINAQQIPRAGASIVEFKADCLIRSK